MGISIKEVNAVNVIQMTDELGFSELENVSQVISKVAEAPKSTVIDMTGLVFLSSLVIRDIVELWKKLKFAKRSMVIVGMSSTILEIFKTTGLNSVLDIRDINVDQAVEKLNVQ